MGERAARPARAARAVALAVAALTASAAVAGCGDDDSGGGAAGNVELVEGVVVDVDSFDNRFAPEELTVEAGTEVRWTNKGRNEHNVLPVEGDAWGAEVEDFAPGDVYVHRFTEPGSYPYYCSLHGTTTRGMVGVVEVTG